ncbi:predicted protein [Naegleria gruberi]|uniref:Predicted protein n=1 Tax=Naegleria gruberi TaxID=5762 RepID=D2V9F6_NAEGR|nr:uncharacterized protein NAEGRDRAFT_65424 [Naegleria gruberi]EFC46582.1 predicted protein [Naegleria gruberi]|eukprot:XP_002679326.1 predicted protein [Naegleria gruberi strain NEG-M]
MKLAIKQQPKCLKFASSQLKNSRDIVLEAVKQDGLVIEYVPEHLKDREIVMEAIKNSKYSCVLQHAPTFSNDKEVILLAAKNSGFSFSYASEKLRSDREFVLQIVKMKGDSLKDVSKELKKDKEIVMEAVKSNGMALYYVDHGYFCSDRSFVKELVLLGSSVNSSAFSSRIARELIHDREFVLECISGAGNSLSFLDYGGSSLVNHSDFVDELIDIQCQYSSAMWTSKDYFNSLNEERQLRIIRIDPVCLEHCKGELKNSRQLVLDYILQDRKILESLNDELRNDREIIRLAIKEHYGALKFASAELQNDKSLLQEALLYDTGNYNYASEELKTDKEILEFLIGRDGCYFEYAPESWKNSRDFVVKAIRNSMSNISDFLGYSLKEDRDLILEYVRRIGSIEEIPQEYKQDRDIVLEAVQLDGNNLKYASHSLQQDRELLIVAVRNGLSLRNINESELDREIVYEACRYDTHPLKYVPEEYRDEEEIVQAIAFSENASSFEYVSERLRNNIDFIRKLTRINGYLIQYIPKYLRNDREIALNAIRHGCNYLSEDLQNDKELILTGLKYSASCYRYASGEMKSDGEVLEALRKWLPPHLNIPFPLNKEMAAIALSIKSLNEFDYTFRDDRQFALLAVNARMMNLMYVSNRLRLDRTFILEIEPKQFDILFIPITLREDREIALKSLELNGRSIMYLSNELKHEFKNDREIMLKAIKSDAIAFLFASEELQHEEEFILECAGVNGKVLQYVPHKFAYNRNVVLKCVQNHEEALQYASNKFLGDKECVMYASGQGKSFNSFCYASFDMRNDPEIVLKAVQSDVTSLKLASYEIISDEDFIEKAMDINIEALCYAHYSLRYNTEFLKRMNKNNRIVESGSKIFRRAIDFNSLLEV